MGFQHISVNDVNGIEKIKEVLNSDEYSLVLTHATWCGHCVNLLSEGGVWKSAVDALSKKINVLEVEHASLSEFKEIQVNYFPCIRIYKKGVEVEEFKSDEGPTVNGLSAFVDKYVAKSSGGRKKKSLRRKSKSRRRHSQRRRRNNRF